MLVFFLGFGVNFSVNFLNLKDQVPGLDELPLTGETLEKLMEGLFVNESGDTMIGDLVLYNANLHIGSNNVVTAASELSSEELDLLDAGIDFDEIVGYLSNGQFSARSDLEEEGNLDNNAGTDILTRDQADGRFVISGMVDSVLSSMIVDGTITAVDLADSAITSVQLADGSVTTLELLDGSVTSAKIADGTIASIDISDSAVITAKILDGAITDVKLADGSISISKLSSSMCSTGEILKKTSLTSWSCVPDAGGLTSVSAGDGLTNSGTVIDPVLDVNVDGTTIEIVTDTLRIADGAITTAKLDDGSVTAVKIVNGSVTSSKLNDGAVTEIKLANNSVTSAKIVDGTISFADLAQNSCGLNQIIKWNGAAWACADDIDTDTDTTYSAAANQGLTLSGTEFGLTDVCLDTQILKWNDTSSEWECQYDSGAGAETDPIFTAWDKSTGISITESQISDLQSYLTSYTETDPVFTAWDKSTGISITESQISDLDHFTTGDEIDPVFTAWDKSTGISITESQISDLQSYLTSYTETDPVYLSDPASGITGTNITNWNTAYGWGDHSLVGYLTSYTETDPIYSAWDKSTGISITESQISDLDHFTTGDEIDPIFTAWDKSTGISITESQISDLQSYLTSYTETDPVFIAWDKSTGISITESQISDLQSYLTSYTETDPVYLADPAAGITGTNITNWNTAYGWGDHSTAGYLTSYTETDPQVGTITTNYVPKWDGSALVTGSIYDNGNVGIGTASPQAKAHLYGGAATDTIMRLEADAGEASRIDFYSGSDRQGYLTYRGDIADPNSYFGFVNLLGDGLRFYNSNGFTNFYTADAGGSDTIRFRISGNADLADVSVLSSRFAVGGTSAAQMAVIGSTDTEQLIVKGNATQTDNLVEFQNSGGTAVASFSGVGGGYFAGDIGIGTSSPGYALDVVSGDSIAGSFDGRVIGVDAVNSDEFVTLGQMTTGGTALWTRDAVNGYTYLTNSGDYVGIGTTNPAYPMQMKTSTANVYMTSIDNTAANGWGLEIRTTNNDVDKYALGIYDNTDTQYDFIVTNSGSVGIGTTTIDSLLTVDYGANTDLASFNSSGNTIVKITSSDTEAIPRYQLANGTQNWESRVYGGVTGLYEDVFAIRDITNSTLPFNIQPNALTGAVFIKPDEFVINEASGDYDFRVESDTNTNALFVQGSDGYIGMGTSSPARELTVYGATTSPGIRVETGLSTGTPNFQFVNGSQAWDFRMTSGGDFNISDLTNTTFPFKIYAGAATNSFIIDASGNVGINDPTPSGLLSVQSNASASNIFYFKASTGSASWVIRETAGNEVYWRGFETGGTETISINPGLGAITEFNAGNFVINNDGLSNVDFRVESDTNDYMLFVNAGTNKVGVGTSTPGTPLEVAGEIRGRPDSTIGMSFLSSITNGPQFQFTNAGTASPDWRVGIPGVANNGDFFIYDNTTSSTFLRFYQSTKETAFMAGDVGIGTTSPGALLGLSAAANLTTGASRPVLKINNTSNGTWGVGVEYGSLEFHSDDISSGAGLRAKISVMTGGTNGSRGELGFFVRSSAGVVQEAFHLVEDGGVLFPLLLGTTGGSDARYNTSTGELFYDTSSIRYKENISEEVDYEWIYDLPVVTYDRIDGSRYNEIGIIAEEVAEIAPEYVNYNKLGQVESWTKSDMVPVLIKAVQEQQEQITEIANKKTLEESYIQKIDQIISDYDAGLFGSVTTIPNDLAVDSISAQVGTFTQINGESLNIGNGSLEVDALGNLITIGIIEADKLVANSIQAKQLVAGEMEDIEMILGDSDGNTNFVIKNTNGDTIFNLDSKGNLEVGGDIKLPELDTHVECTEETLGYIKYEDDHFYGCKSNGWTQLD